MIYIITRPLEQALPLINKLKQLNKSAIACPLLKITAYPIDGDKLLNQLISSHYVIVTSPNAAKYSVKFLRQKIRAKIIPMGLGTENVLAAEGIVTKFVKTGQYNSKALLSHPDLQNLAGKLILILTGSPIQPWLTEQLQKAGAIVTTIPIYQRFNNPLTEEMRASFFDANNTTIIISSQAALAYLWSECPAESISHLQAKKWLVSSEHLKSQLEISGAKQIILAKNATDEGIIDGIIHSDEVIN